MGEFSNLPQGTIVRFTSGPILGYGKICGSHHTPIAALGTGYIVEILETKPALPNETYPYTHMAIEENSIVHITDDYYAHKGIV
jgi:hypothetical protein